MKTKHIFLLGMITIFFIPQLVSQGFDGKARWVMGLGIQQQDRRLYDLPIDYAKELLEQASGIPTVHLHLAYMKPILHRQDFSLDMGMGYSLEVNSFSRPFNPAPLLKEPSIFPSREYLLGGYFIHAASGSIGLSYRLLKLSNGGILFFSCDALASAHWLKWIREKTPEFQLFSPSRQYRITIAPYSLEINPGLGLEKGPFRITMNYRAWQTKQVDPVLFFGRISNSISDDPFETYNPTKIWLTVSRDLDWGKGKELRR